jgi:hypothetical protein
MLQEMLDFLKILLITLPQVKKRMILTCFRCLVLVIMIRMYVLYHNRFLKFQILEFSPLLINLLPPLLRIFWVHVQHLMFFNPI